MIDKRVMIVDDEPDVLLSLKIIFERNNFDVVALLSGKDCLLELEKGYKGMILIDLMMPGMDGWDTINEIVNRGYIKDVTISIITGKGTKNFQKMSSLGSYIYDYITKPFDIDKLLASVEKCYREIY